MTPRFPESRAELIRQVEARVTHPACQRAFRTGTVEVLGKFRSLPPTGTPGWVLKTTTTHGRTFRLAWSFSPASMRFELGSLKTVPWTDWLGSFGGTDPLIDGDHPRNYPPEYPPELIQRTPYD